jgi:hypothetical protein
MPDYASLAITGAAASDGTVNAQDWTLAFIACVTPPFPCSTMPVSLTLSSWLSWAISLPRCRPATPTWARKHLPKLPRHFQKCKQKHEKTSQNASHRLARNLKYGEILLSLWRDSRPRHPEGLFPEPRPSNLITEDACESCNNGFSKDDELFAVYLSAALSGNEAAKCVWKNKALKRILSGSRGLANSPCSRRHEEEGSDRAWWCRGRRSHDPRGAPTRGYYFESPRALFGISIQHSTTRLSNSPFNAYGPRRRASNSFKNASLRRCTTWSGAMLCFAAFTVSRQLSRVTHCSF